MEQDLRLRSHLHSPTFPSDPEPFPELTRSGSYSDSDSSATTVDNTSRDTAPFLDTSRRWTDQLHKLYLSSLEASFVNELHHSIHLRGRRFHNNADEAYKCRALQNTPTMPRQSLALQDGFQEKINLEKIAPMLESAADSHVLAGSEPGFAMVDKVCSLREPITYDHGLFRNKEIHASGSSPSANRSAKSCLEKQCSFNEESGCSSTEVTDQNFKDEVASSSSMPKAKRLKTAAANGSSTDQVVPFGKFQTTDVSTVSNSTPENEGQELLSELPESFRIPKSDLPFLQDR
ncbi:cold-regulated protein 27 isoform X1 [Trifolium pratense]|nr:cold-regulated protein 27 isoform X1 [Trifolium pratense]